MPTWDKENIVIQLITTTGTTLGDDTSTHTVQFQPVDSAFSTNAVLGTQGTSNLSRYMPVSDLDSSKSYDIHLSHATTPIGRIHGKDTITLASE